MRQIGHGNTRLGRTISHQRIWLERKCFVLPRGMLNSKPEALEASSYRVHAEGVFDIDFKIDAASRSRATIGYLFALRSKSQPP